jgi:predicted dehydrogenase/threonine dehydrogenase-like Zn-dependent dehydrogenase
MFWKDNFCSEDGMKQILQDLKSGETQLIEVPRPRLKPGHLLIHTTASLVSVGTERMLMEFARAGWIEKARQQPDKVKQVIDKIKTDGLLPTIEAVQAKLDQPLPLGYCHVGIVAGVGGSTAELGFREGDRVVSNGPHAEWVCVPKNLCARIPDQVADEAAAFAVLGAIGLQGVRLAQPTLGECFVVQGLGLIGLLTVQILRANGCRVLGVDLDPAKCALARQFGAATVDLSQGQDLLSVAQNFSRGRGVDGVLITAATKSNELIHQAAEICRQRGRIVLVGVTGLDLRRDDFYKKELSFQVSCSYGPGRYDPEYEDKGHDYPLGFVRWTEQRNLEAVLDLLVAGKLDVTPLITHKFPINEAIKAYEVMAAGKEQYIAMLLTYGQGSGLSTEPSGMEPGLLTAGQDTLTGAAEVIRLGKTTGAALPGSGPILGLIGAGAFTGKVILPALRKTGARLKTIASSGGVSGTHLGKKFGFEASATDPEQIFADPDINAVLISTPHHTHARLVLAALEAGKQVFVEKPLCLTKEELHQIESAMSARKPTAAGEAGTGGQAHSAEMPILMVGFNRRFAPQVQKIKGLLAGIREPLALIMIINAGFIPANHWTQDPETGGGRIIGEVCHFVDLLRYLTGTSIIEVNSGLLRKEGPQDTLSVTLNFADGSLGTIHYFANGNKAFPKERLEIFGNGRVLQLDNFRQLRGFGWPGFKKMNLWRQDKGHEAEIQAFVQAVQAGTASPIPFEEIVEVTRTTLEIAHNR